jgi:hypothetical protein
MERARRQSAEEKERGKIGGWRNTQKIQKNTQKIELCTTMAWPMEKTQGGTTGCKNFRNVLMSKECNIQNVVEKGEVFSYCQNYLLKK